MKIIAINGSPKKERSTAYLLQAVLQAALDEGIETEMIHLTDYNIKQCIGCNKCLRAGVCSIQDDDMKILDEKMLTADGIIFGSPTYLMNVSGTMKVFLDRTRPLHTYFNKLKGKVGGAVTVAGMRHGGQEFVMDYLERYMRSMGMILADYQELPTMEPRMLFTGGAIGAIYKAMDGDKIIWNKDASEDPAALAGANFLGKNMAFLIKKLGKVYE